MIEFLSGLFSISHQTVIGASAGGVVSVTAPGGSGILARGVKAICSALIALSTAPLVSFVLEYPPKLDLPVAFLIGLFGFPAAGAIFRMLRGADLWAVIVNRFGGSKHD